LFALKYVCALQESCFTESSIYGSCAEAYRPSHPSAHQVGSAVPTPFLTAVCSSLSLETFCDGGFPGMD